MVAVFTVTARRPPTRPVGAQRRRPELPFKRYPFRTGSRTVDRGDDRDALRRATRAVPVCARALSLMSINNNAASSRYNNCGGNNRNCRNNNDNQRNKKRHSRRVKIKVSVAQTGRPAPCRPCTWLGARYYNTPRCTFLPTYLPTGYHGTVARVSNGV